MTEESWCDKVIREHPWWYRWAKFTMTIEMAWDWVRDAPYWNDDLTAIVGFRTGRFVMTADEHSRQECE